MAVEPIDYLELTRQALRGVMANALSHAAENGLAGDQHFYVTYRTTLPGVVIPSWLLERYPEEMTIVIQYEYWELAVMADRFSIGLSFDDRPVTLVVPFAAVRTFADPSVNFQLDIPIGEDELPEAAVDEVETVHEGTSDSEDAVEPVEMRTGDEDTVVSLDAFRKK